MKADLEWIPEVQLFISITKQNTYILSQNRTGFSHNEHWYVFPEQAVYLKQISAARIIKQKQELALIDVYEMIFDHPQDRYNNYNVCFFYAYLRKQGCLGVRRDVEEKKKEMEAFLGIVNKNLKRKKKENRLVLFDVYQRVEDYSNRINGQIYMITTPNSRLDINQLNKNQGIRKVAVVENADLNIIRIFSSNK